MTFRGISEERVIFIAVNGVTKNQNIEKSSRPEVFCKKGVLRNFTKFKGKHLRQSLFFNKVSGQAKLQHFFL